MASYNYTEQCTNYSNIIIIVNDPVVVIYDGVNNYHEHNMPCNAYICMYIKNYI